MALGVLLAYLAYLAYPTDLADLAYLTDLADLAYLAYLLALEAVLRAPRVTRPSYVKHKVLLLNDRTSTSMTSTSLVPISQGLGFAARDTDGAYGAVFRRSPRACLSSPARFNNTTSDETKFSSVNWRVS